MDQYSLHIVIDPSGAKQGAQSAIKAINDIVHAATQLNSTITITSTNLDKMGGTAQKQATHMRTAFNSLRDELGSVAKILAIIQPARLAESFINEIVRVDRVYNGFIAMMDVTTGSIAKSRQEYEYVTSVARTYGVALENLTHSYARLSASANQLLGESGVKKLFESFTAVSSVLHAERYTVERMFNAIIQMASKGQVHMEELKQQLGEHLPGALAIAAQAMDMEIGTMIDKMKKGQISAQDLLVPLPDLLMEKFGAAAEITSKSLNAAFANLHTSFFDLFKDISTNGAAKGLAEVLRAIDERVQASSESAAILGEVLGGALLDLAEFIKLLKPEDIRAFAEGLVEIAKVSIDVIRFLAEGTLFVAQYKEEFLLAAGVMATFKLGISPLIASLTAAGVGFTTAAGSVTLMQRSMAALSAFAAGWMFGTYLREEFEVVDKYSIKFVGFMMKIPVWIKGGFELLKIQIPLIMTEMFESILNFTVQFINEVKSMGGAVARFFGFDVADPVFKPFNFTSGLYVELSEAKSRVKQELGEVDSIIDDMLRDSSNRFAAKNGKSVNERLGIDTEKEKETLSILEEYYKRYADATRMIGESAPSEGLSKEFEKLSQKGLELAKSLTAVDSGLSGDFYEKWMSLAAAYTTNDLSLDELIEAQRLLLKQQPLIKKNIDEEAKLVEEYAKNVSAMISPLEEKAQAAEYELEVYGLTESQIQDTIIARLEEAKAIAQANGALDSHIAFFEREIEARKRIAAATNQIDVLKENDKAAEEAAKEWQKTADKIEDSLTDALMRGFENGESLGENLKNTLENMFKTLVLRPTIQAIVNPIAGIVNDITQGFIGNILGTGGGGSGVLSVGSKLLDAYKTGDTVLDYGSKVLNYGRDLYNYASGMTASVGGQSLYTGAMSYAPTAQMSMAPGTTSYFGAQSAFGNGVNVGATGSGTGGSAMGAYGAGLAGGLWAYNATGSYAMGVGGAAIGMGAYGAATGYIASGVSGVASGIGGAAGLGAIPGWGWVAALVVGILADVFSGDPDPRVVYKMKSELGDLAEWEDGDAYREGPFGYVGLDNAGSREVRSKDFRKQLDSLVAFDSMLASLMSADEIERVRTDMDGWTSSANRNDRDFRRNGELALTERMIDIARAAGGAQWDELLQYMRTTEVGSPNKVLSSGYGDTYQTWETPEPVIPRGTTLADLFGFRDVITDFSNSGAAGINALRAMLAESLGVSSVQSELEFAKSNDGSTWKIQRLTDELAEIQAQIPTSLDELAAALESRGLSRSEIEEIAIAAANANPYGSGREGNRLAKLSDVDSEALSKFLIRGLQIDDLQSMLSKLGQSIDRDSARNWMNDSAYSYKDENGKNVDVDGYMALMTNLSQSYASMYQTIDDVWTQTQTNLVNMFASAGVELPSTIDAFKKLTEAQDLTTQSGRDLYQQLWSLAPAFLEVAKVVENTINSINQSTLQTVEMFMTDVMTNAEKYAYIDDRIVATLENLSTATSPDMISSLYTQANNDLKAAWGLLQDDEKRRLRDEFIERAQRLETLSTDRLSVAPLEAPEAQTEAQAKAIGKAVEDAVSRALAGVATQMQSAGTEQFEAATQLGAAVASLPERIVVEIRSQGGEVMLG